MSYRWIVLAALTAVLGTGGVHGSAPEASEIGHRAEPRVKQQLVGAGKWESNRNDNDGQGWHIQLKRLDDDSLSGRITIVGSPLIQQARIEGQISGRDVYGVIVGDDNVQVATFSGSVFKSGMSGTYTTTDGDSGNWSWDGSLPDDQPPTSTVEPPTLQTQ
jgi:hypothetical protein